MITPPTSEYNSRSVNDRPMTVSCRLVLILSMVFTSLPNRSLAKDEKVEVEWHDASSFGIEGRGWEKTATPYGRLPDSVKSKVNGLAWELSNNNPGVCIRFLTDAPVIKVRWSLIKGGLAMPHMAATGVSGVDLYTRSGNGSWVFVGNGRPGNQDNNVGEFEFRGKEKGEHECLLYLPAYNGIKSLEIGAPSGARLEKPGPRPEAQRKPVVVYGTSIAQGACASRPGMVWSAILGRMLDRPAINLGFSASGGMDPRIGEVLAEIDASAFVIDCTWNMSDEAALYQDRVPKLVHAIRQQRPDAPIIFVGQSEMRPESHPTKFTEGQEAAVRALQAEGVKGLITVPGTDLIGNDGDGTVDGVHLSDVGMLRQAQALFPVVKNAVNGPSKPHVYIDTDMAAEIDDSFAVYRALIAPELNVVGVSSIGWQGPLDFPVNTQASQKMIEDVLALLGLKESISHPIGAMNPMPEKHKPVDCPAARDIIAKAKAVPIGEKLQVFVLGAYTNVASALLLDPGIRDNLTVHVMGFRYDDARLTTNESNCQSDLHAAAWLLESGVELKIMPSSTLRQFQWSKADADTHLKGKGGVRDYLVKRWESYAPNSTEHTQWDIAVFEAFLRPQLATLSKGVHDDAGFQIWTGVDIPGMKADYWEATKSPVPAVEKPVAPATPVVISKGEQSYSYQAFPDACRLKNGDILVAFYAGYNHVSLAADDFPLGGRLCLVRSSDEGHTWTAPEVLYDDADDNRDAHLSQLDDGTVVCTFFSIAEKNRQRLKTIKDPKNYELPRTDTGVQIILSHDDGKTWEPQAREVIPGWLCSAPARQLPDGTCVLGLYRGDEKTGLSIAGTARSTDRGRTWETPVAIKAPAGVGLNAETDVIRLANGRLYAAMRSFTDDMYYAVSNDEAKSWSGAEKAGFPAHAPHLNRLSDGSIILSHRLPKTSIHVSHDDTKTWQGPFQIDSCIGAYPATVELKDHSILIVYYTEGGGSAIRARRFNLKPDGIEFLPL